MVNPTARPLARLYLWLLPNRFDHLPAGIDDVTFFWLYPERFDGGWMKLARAEARVAGGAARPARVVAEPHAIAGRGVLVALALAEPIAPGARAEIALRYRARAPARFGSFGCVEGQCTLAGGFYPMLAGLDAAGFDLAAPPAEGRVEVHVGLAAAGSIVLFDQWSGDETRSFAAAADHVPYATLVVAPALYESAQVLGGARVRYLSPTPPPPPVPGPDRVLPYTLEDYGELALDTVAAAYRLLGDVDPGLRPRSLTLVVAPLRWELTSAQPDVVLVSDRFYRIWPAERFRKFHRRQLVRAVFAAYLGRRLAGQPSVAASERARSADVAASYLTDLFVVRRYDTREFVDQILRPVSFIPAIDQLLYAPQTLFADAYFGTIGDDADPLGDDADRFMSLRPRGRLVYEKLRDLLPVAALDRAMRRIAVGGLAWQAAAEAEVGHSFGWFARQWSLPYPRVDYRLVGHTSRRRGDGWDDEIVVDRRVAPGDVVPVEPVTVRVRDRDGREHRLRWDGHGSRVTLRLRAASPIASVTVDPDERLGERKLGGETDNPRWNDRDDHPIRFVYHSLGVLLNLSDLSALLAANFTLSRVHDLHRQLHFVAYTSATTRLGASAAYQHGFGPEVTPDRLLYHLSFGVAAARLNTAFFSDAGDRARPATRFSLSASLLGDDEVFDFEPLEKHNLNLALELDLTRQDADATGPHYLPTAELDLEVSRTLTARVGHTLALELQGALAVGRLETRAQLVAAGGGTGVRGYGPGALFGRGLGLVRLEYRHSFVHHLDWNVGHYAFMRGFGGVAFADGGVVLPCDSYDLGGAVAVGSLGYGLQMFYENFGTLPGLMRLDGAVRIGGGRRDCLGAVSEPGPRLQVYLTFVPPF